MRNRNFRLVVASSLLVICACSDSGDPGTGVGTWRGTPNGTPYGTPYGTPTPLAPLPPPQSIPAWTGDATVVSVVRGTAQACGWGTTPGAARSGVGWNITVTADSILLDEDTSNWPTDDVPYSGHLDGAQFTTSYKSGSDYARYVCQFREATLNGSFTSDSTFDAVETLVWGEPGKEATVVRHWTGSRL